MVEMDVTFVMYVIVETAVTVVMDVTSEMIAMDVTVETAVTVMMDVTVVTDEMDVTGGR